DSTRHLCIAAHLDRSFRDFVIAQLIDEKYKAIAQSVGVDLPTVVKHCLQAKCLAVHHYGGYIVQSTGDGIFALFGAPVAHEDHPQRALYAALGIQDQIRRYADELRTEGHAPLQIRIGVNAGEVVVRSIRIGEAKSEYTP